MPSEVRDIEQINEIINRTIECRVKRIGDVVKLKFKTRSKLYTVKLDPSDAEKLLDACKKNNIKVVDV